MAGDPADVGGAPVDVVVFEVENDLRGVGGVGQVAAGGVVDALGLAGGAGGVEDEQHVLGVHGLGRAVALDIVVGHDVVPPDVAAGLHLDVVAGVAQHDALFDGGAFLEGFVGVGLQRYGLARADDGVADHDDFRFAVVDAVAQAMGREAGENDAVGRADAGAGQHGDGQLRHHGQVQAHPVALFDAHLLEHIGEAADFVVEHLIGVGAHVFVFLALPDDGGLVAAAVGQMAVQAVIGGVELAAAEPFDFGGAEIVFEDLVPGGFPGQQFGGALGPVALGVFDGAFVDGAVFVEAFDVGGVASSSGRFEGASFLLEALDIVGGHGFLPVGIWRRVWGHSAVKRPARKA